jgi:hypothetical protein
MNTVFNGSIQKLILTGLMGVSKFIEMMQVEMVHMSLLYR